MRAIHPLREILDAAMLKEDPLLDTEWPAADMPRNVVEPSRAPAPAPVRAPLVHARP